MSAKPSLAYVTSTIWLSSALIFEPRKFQNGSKWSLRCALLNGLLQWALRAPTTDKTDGQNPTDLGLKNRLLGEFRTPTQTYH